MPTVDGNVSLQAGAGLGGGTTINWTNCLRTTPWVREQWAREHGLEGVDGPDYDRHLDAVLERIGVNDALQRLQRPDPADEGGRRERSAGRSSASSATPTRRPTRPETAGLHGLRRHSGSKQSTAKTYLARRRRRRAPRSRADRALAAGPGRGRPRRRRRGTLRAIPESGRAAEVTVRAPQVVVACGSLESPALLLRSGIGGPAVGRVPAPAPLHRDVRQLRRGPARLVGRAPRRARRRVRRRRGRLRLPDRGRPVHDRDRRLGAAVHDRARSTRQRWSDFRHGATFIGLLRDRGARPGDDRRRRPGACPPTRSTDEVDVAQHAARDRGPGPAARGGRGASRSGRSPPGAGAVAARRRPRRVHRPRSAGRRCGAGATACSPPTRWAPAGWAPTRRRASPDPWGELHDTPGVWIGDAQRLPDLLRHQPDDLDHGARPPHRRGDRRRGSGAGRRAARLRRLRNLGGPEQMATHGRDPGPRQALHRRRVGRPARARRRSTSSTPPPRR